jgi:hypothetical protein
LVESLAAPRLTLMLTALSRDVATLAGILILIAAVAALILFGRPTRLGPLLTRIAIVIAAAAVFGFLHFHATRQETERQRRARDAVVLLDVSMWTDGIDMFENLVRVRFRYRNTTPQRIDGFAAHFMLLDSNDLASPIEPKATSSWTVTYWATCPQGFSPPVWEVLTHRDIRDLTVEWTPHDLVFADGRVVP